MSETSEKKLETVRKLLDRAAHPNTPEAEAEQCRDRAYSLMAKHQIDDAMLADGRMDANDVERLSIAVEAPYAKEKSTLLSVIATQLGCRTMRYPRDWSYKRSWESYVDSNGEKQRRRSVSFRYGKGADVTVMGFPGDLERVEMLYTTLMLHAVGDMRRAAPESPFEDVGAFRASFLMGFASRIGARLEEQRKRASAEADSAGGRGAELVLRDRSQLVNDAFEELSKGAYQSRGSSYSGSGRGVGARSAETADLGGGKVGAGARGRLSV